jgi:hypothetical protein
MDRKTIGYWGATALLALAMGGGGIVDLMQGEDVLAVLDRLGYPAYLATLLGVAKLIGVVVVLVPGLPRLKEWAYAGFVIDLIGAFWSHLAVGDPIGEALPPVAVLAITLASWALRPDLRRLGG